MDKFGTKTHGLTVIVRDDVNRALKKLKKKVEDSKILEELKKREGYEKPSIKRQRDLAAAKSRYKKKLQKEFLPKKLY